jgi:glycosyltransferase 2 family protein
MPHGRFAGFRSKSRKTRTPGANHCAAAIANLGAMNQPMEPNKPKRLQGVIDAARLTQRFCEVTIGWGRIGVVISLTIIAIALYVLYNILRGIDFNEVVQALVSTQPRDIMLAALFVAGGYFTLTFYDLFALRTIGRPDVPYRIAALGGFTSYSIGHNVGASVFTGGAVRYRVYSAWGLDAIEVAKLCFIAGLTFWLGNATVLGLGIAYVPDGLSAINQLPNWFNRLLAFATLCVLALYVAWVWTGQRVVGREGWQVTLPGGPLTLLQIGIGIVDLTFCAFAMYMLMPDEPHIGFVTLAVIFVSATLLGFASHSPGGIGVFDAAMLVALWQYHKADLLAGLLLFRLLYYIVPFALSLLILGLREIILAVNASRARARLPSDPTPGP